MPTRPKIQPVIMSGGAGTRLWPMSRAKKPKQFLPLASPQSLFQETALRLSGSSEAEFLKPVVIGGAMHEALIRAQLAAISIEPAAIIIEPMPRNTAAVAAVASAWGGAHAPDALILLAPADHHVADAPRFRSAIANGAPAAAKGAIITFGIRPSEPHTGFGYIEAGASLGDGVAEVAGFREKPDLETARRYVSGGRHFWNAGVFLFAPDAMDNELHAYAPTIRKAASAAFAAARRAGDVIHLDAERFAACPSDSIDYAVMEKTARAAVVGPIEAGWSDIGSWTAIAPSQSDRRIIAIDSDGAVIRTDGPLVGAIDAGDLVIVATGDAVLVAPKSRAQDVKRIIEELKARGRDDLL
jgi:mannose-1-phosphate guanylyltransferase/mannose-6-phosphate isomerase